MADKEPRRRKKNRRDSQKKDDVRPDDQFFVPQKPEPRDSDQEIEEEPVIHGSHQPSNVAKIVFVILFSGLVVSLSFIFISLRYVDEGPVDIFDAGHDDHHGEVLHDEHVEEALHDDHDEHAEHEESEISFGDILPSIGSMLSLNDEQVKEETEPVAPPEVAEEIIESKEEDVVSYTPEPEVTTDQGVLEEYIEDTSTTSSSIEEPVTSTEYPEVTSSLPFTEDESLFTTFDYSEADDFSTPSMQPEDVEPPPQPFTETSDLYDAIPPLDDFKDDEDDEEEENAPENFGFYERADITNEADFLIRDQLDEIEDIVEKESNIEGSDNDDDNANDDGDDEDDDDEDNNDEGVEEEFDFWQF